MSRAAPLATSRLVTFNSEAEAGRLPYAGTSFEKWYAHGATKGFYVVVSRPNERGEVQRWYAVRYGTKGADGATRDKRRKLGTVGALGYRDAHESAAAELNRAALARETGSSLLPTLREAFDDYMNFKMTLVADEKKLKSDTIDDYTRRFNELIPVAWHNKAIDLLTPALWTELRRDSTTFRSFEVRGRKPVGEARFDGMLRGFVSGLYRRQREKGHSTLVNPVPVLRSQGVLSTGKQRHDFIATEYLPSAWSVLHTEMRASQRDIALIGLLTGWRLQLMTKIPLDRIKPKKRAVEWRSSDPGGPYHEKDADAFDYPVSNFLWERVFEPRLAAVKPGQKYLIESGRKPGEAFSDIRDSLKLLDDRTGCHVTAQVLRKTYLTLSPASGAPQRAISHLAMHKTSSGAAVTGGSNTTANIYQKRDFTNMKTATNQISSWFALQVGEVAAPPVQTAHALSVSRLAALQALAEIPEEQLAKILKLADALK